MNRSCFVAGLRVACFCSAWLFVSWPEPSLAQFAGARGGAPSVGARAIDGNGADTLPRLSAEIAESFIIMDGMVELRVAPSGIRIVLAISTEGVTSAQCNETSKTRIAELRRTWVEAGFRDVNIVEDFIAILPKYGYRVETQEGQRVAVETKTGYIMQTNLHLSVRDDAEATKALNIAFERGVSDIIAFDYWSDQLDALKEKAQNEALKVAKAKSERFLGSLFDEKPTPINLQENTHVHFPVSLYESFDNSYASEFQTSFAQRDISVLRLFRPKNTYYRGLTFNGDKQSDQLPMRPEISVVSTVRLYFESPAAKSTRLANKKVAP